jgi:VWFA-related protein
MKTVTSSSKGNRIRALIWSSLFLLALMMFSTGRQNWASPQNDRKQAGTAENDITIKVGVEEVRLDAVVLDKEGYQVTGLTASDFEIRQDGLPQKITACTYINDYQPQPPVQAAVPQGSRTMLPTPMLKRENVRRTIAFVVDNLTMEFEQVHRARMGLQKFVETQMQPGDLVTIIPTAGGNAASQVFSSDKQYLLSIIDNLRWQTTRHMSPWKPQLLSIAYCIGALRNMPGRKSLILMSPQTMLAGTLIDDIGVFQHPISPTGRLSKDDFNPLADAALRAGVVVHTLDIRGLQGPREYYSDFDSENNSLIDASHGNNTNGNTSASVDSYISTRTSRAALGIGVRNSEFLIPLSEKTGGLFIRNLNWFDNGVGSVNETLKGYYMLAYSPPANTFSRGLKGPYHRIKIRVKQPNSVVYSRDGFFGTTQPVDAAASAVAFAGTQDPGSLQAAIYSPFQYNDLSVNLASGYIQNPQKGYLLQSWLHLDAKNLSILEGKDGSHSISLEAVCVTAGIDNTIQDSNAQQYLFKIKQEEIPWIKENGLRFSISLPVKKPGAYYIRIAIKDLTSGKMGSAYQFAEIPDLSDHHLALSNIFPIIRDADLPWARSGSPQESQNLLYPDMRKDASQSPAIRSYLPGESIEYAAVVYNAETGKEQKPSLESQYLLFRNGKELLKSGLEAIDLSSAGDLKRIQIKKKLVLENSFPPGDYMLQLLVMEKLPNKKQNTATQVMDFRVLGK